ncbi:MAG: hypothetical protein IIZ78_01255 [Clostridiales bacterium]|nr:hypothetical protein [Clostridiales bacterium]
MRQYKVEIKTPADTVIDTAVTDDALKASEYMESKLADLPDGYWGHIQVITEERE